MPKLNKLNQYTQHLIAYPKLPDEVSISAPLLNQITRELAIGTYLEKEWPSMALVFGFEDNLTPETDSYQHRLIGHLTRIFHQKLNFRIECF